MLFWWRYKIYYISLVHWMLARWLRNALKDIIFVCISAILRQKYRFGPILCTETFLSNDNRFILSEKLKVSVWKKYHSVIWKTFNVAIEKSTRCGTMNIVIQILSNAVFKKLAAKILFFQHKNYAGFYRSTQNLWNKFWLVIVIQIQPK